MVQIVICRSLFTLNVILNLVLYAVNINDIHVLLLFFYLFIYLFFFIRQSVIVFQEIGKNKKIKKKKGRERERRRSIHFLN